jgi:hypothetical protein
MHAPQAPLSEYYDVVPSGCWEWNGCVKKDAGYGISHRSGRTMQAHRAVWIWLRGPIAPGLQLDHLCRNRRCVNPDHLEPVTPLENTRRALALRTTCRKGHPYTPENTYYHPDGSQKACRTCRREEVRRRHWVKPAEWHERRRARRRELYRMRKATGAA